VTFSWAEARPRQPNHELIWLIVSVGSLGAASAWFISGLPWPRCLFHDLTGLPCLTCGATRATVEFLHGRWWAALKWNPLVFTILCAVTLFNAYAIAVLTMRAPRLRLRQFRSSEKKGAVVVLITAVALNWIYLLSHWGTY
jgi:hypothetical protein